MSSPALSGALFDPWALVPRLADLRARARSYDFAGLSTALEALRGDELLFAVRGLGDVTGLADRLARYVAGRRGTPVPQALLGRCYVAEGWRIRSAYDAAHVSERQLTQFHALLRRAEGHLIETCARHPEYLPAWETRITIARGLELGTAEARRRYDRVRALDPWCYPAQAEFLQQVCPKWGGSWDAAHAFAAECRDGAPPGTLSPAVGVTLHLEHWVWGDRRGGRRYLRQPAVLDDLRNIATLTVWHPDHVPGPYTATVHSDLAMAFALAGMPALAAPHFRALGESPAEGCWGYTGDAALEYRKHRAAAFRAEGRG
ncbi:hypothetical protein GCM10028784_24360 [Myceligenerans cantabricum]